MNVSVAKLHFECVGDCKDIDRIIHSENIPFHALKAIVSKVNGNGSPNDYSRQWAEQNFIAYLEKKYGKKCEDIKQQITFITSSGCEGLVTPTGFLFFETGKSLEENTNQDGLVIGTSETRSMTDKEIGTIVHAELVCEAVKKAATEASITNLDSIGLVFVKSPILRGGSDMDTNANRSIPLTRAASAIGVGLSLEEISKDALTLESIGSNFDIYSRKAFTFSGNELQNCRVVLLGNSPNGNINLYIRSGVIADLLDTQGIKRILLEGDAQKKMAAFFAKVSVHPSGIIRGKRVALVDTDLSISREIRASASGLFAALLQNTENFISAGAEHQGPAGGGVIGAIFRRKGI